MPRTQLRVSSRVSSRTHGLTEVTDLPPMSPGSPDDLLAVSTQRLDNERRPTGPRKRLRELMSSQQSLRLTSEVTSSGWRTVTIKRRPGARPGRRTHTAGLGGRRGACPGPGASRSLVLRQSNWIFP